MNTGSIKVAQSTQCLALTAAAPPAVKFEGCPGPFASMRAWCKGGELRDGLHGNGSLTVSGTVGDREDRMRQVCESRASTRLGGDSYPFEGRSQSGTEQGGGQASQEHIT
mmetsp:Transcript_14589/g.29348  ORF Transcript_14589/g.29348 Transcript_14589/m.29348 type:complete len:110 (+) Transcript_14589:63-392(+)